MASEERNLEKQEFLEELGNGEYPSGKTTREQHSSSKSSTQKESSTGEIDSPKTSSMKNYTVTVTEHEETKENGIDVGITTVYLTTPEIKNKELPQMHEYPQTILKRFEGGREERIEYTYQEKPNGFLERLTETVSLYNHRGEHIQDVVKDFKAQTTTTTAYEDTYTEKVIRTPTEIIIKVMEKTENAIPKVSVVARQDTPKGIRHTR